MVECQRREEGRALRRSWGSLAIPEGLGKERDRLREFPQGRARRGEVGCWDRLSGLVRAGLKP